jgi:murein DD-endopeptidase MepM/ murein hydrolase activator NlpD
MTINPGMKNSKPLRMGAGWAARLLLALAFLLSPVGAGAQENSPSGPVYIIQEGDSLWGISLRFGVSVNELMQANGILDAGQIGQGTRLVIPGLEGLEGVLTTEPVPLGDNLRSLSRRYRVPQVLLARLNHLAHPGELYVGASLILPVEEDGAGDPGRVELAAGQSLLELAVLTDENPWSLVRRNALPGAWSPLPGDVLYMPGAAVSAETGAGPGALPGFITSLQISPSILEQGRVASVQVGGPAGLQLSGSLGDSELHFFPSSGGQYFAIQGIHAMADPGLYTLTVRGEMPGINGPVPFAFSQPVFVRLGGYPVDPVLTVSPETLDPAITQPEDSEWKALAQNFSPEKLWEGKFASPVPPEFSDCFPSIFGSRRSYNGSPYQYYHTGLDFCGGVGTDIYAPADGIVVFAGPLTVRGNATMIDHGWGVYSGYMHQSEILVSVGDRVKAGQLIGKIGRTGRVTGPHLHWEIFAGELQVDPADWLEKAFP